MSVYTGTADSNRNVIGNLKQICLFVFTILANQKSWMLKTIMIEFHMKGFSKWCIIFMKNIFPSNSSPTGSWAIWPGKNLNSLISNEDSSRMLT